MNKGTPATLDRRTGGQGLRIGSRLRVRRACLTLLALTLLGCSDDGASPLAPTPIASSNQGGSASGGLATPSVAVEGRSGPLAPGAGSNGFLASPETSPAGIDGGSAVVVAPTAVSELGPGSLDLPAAGFETPAIPFDHAAALAGAPDSGLEIAALPAGARTATHHGPCPAAGGDALDLKAGAPGPLEPIGGAEVSDRRPFLVVSNAAATFVPDATFGYRFALDRRVGGRYTAVEGGCGSPRDGSSTSYQVTGELERGASYRWRARAFLDGAYGPWSGYATFRTPAFRLGVPAPVAPVDGVRVPVSTLFTVRNPTVEGTVNGPVHIEIRVATDAGITRVVKTGRTHVRADRNQTDIALSGTLMPETRYWWQARATASAGAAGQVRSAWSAAASFRTSAHQLSPPRPLLPRDGAVDVPIRRRPEEPQFTVRNTSFAGYSGVILVRLEVARDPAFADIVARQRNDPGSVGVRQRPGRETNIWITNALEPNARYYWRVSAKLGNRDVTSDWSTPAWSFTTGTDSGPSTREPVGCCPPNEGRGLRLVLDVAEARSHEYRQGIAGVDRFTQHVAECLAVQDSRWGRRRNDSGTIGKDTVAYNWPRGPGSGPYSIDILQGATGSNPIPHWTVQEHDGIEGRVGGTFIPIANPNCVLD